MNIKLIKARARLMPKHSIQFEKSLGLFRSVQFLFKSFEGNLNAAISNSSFPRAIHSRQRQLINCLEGPFRHVQLSLILGCSREYQSAVDQLNHSNMNLTPSARLRDCNI